MHSVNSGPVVCAESTIFSELGLPAPYNRQALERCAAAVEMVGVAYSVTAVLDGQIELQVHPHHYDRICGPARKVAARDLAVAVAQKWGYGATTVSASLMIAHGAGMKVFATGGIGGVHIGAETTGDISADLEAIARYPVVTVSAGAKVFLDLQRTVEHLEMLSVPVLGWNCDEFPAFHARSSGLPVTHRVESEEEVAQIAKAHWALGGGGVLVVAPVPKADALEWETLKAAANEAVARAQANEISGNAVTPAVLSYLAELTNGRSIDANLALAENNASIAAHIAVELRQALLGG